MKRILQTFLLTLLIIILLNTGSNGEDLSSGVRLPAVSGQFYPSEPKKLELVIRQYLNESEPIPMETPIALLVPHAGYLYSGQTSADAYRQIADREYDIFVILGVNHTAGNFRGISIADYDSYRTPLGDVPIDRSLAAELIAESSDCIQSRTAHEKEHSIEIQLPFLQILSPETKILPVIIHPPDLEMCLRFGKALAQVLKNKKALIIISSDLAHYPNALDAVQSDSKTLRTIAGMNPVEISTEMRIHDAPNLSTRACGEAAILSGIKAAQVLGAERAVVTGYSNSGDIILGDKTRTVGYGGIAFVPGKEPNDLHLLERTEPSKSATPLTDSEKKKLLEFSRKTLE